MKKIALIGSTGSIGRQVLNVVRKNPEDFEVFSMSCGNNIKLFAEQIKEFHPKIATSAVELPERIYGTEYFFGENAFLHAIVKDVDLVVVSLVGFLGLYAVIEAIKKKKNISLANKESLVVGGEFVTEQANKSGVEIYPIDSEHSAVWQALSFDKNKEFKRIILTASGGALRDYTKEMLKTATAKDALLHPNWDMGDKITVDCATLVNKGFEVIEAKWLYNASFDKIDVIIHRESIIHSMVEYNDGSVIAQMSYPSMELPIEIALSYPERKISGLKSLDFVKIGKLTFEKTDNERFPCLNLVISAGKAGGLYPAVVNGANEQAVKLFLEQKIKYNDIYAGLDFALSSFSDNTKPSLDSVIVADAFGRNAVKKLFGE